MLHKAPLITLPNLPKNPMPNMVSPFDASPDSWTNAGYGSATAVETLGSQRLNTMPQDLGTGSRDLRRQQQSMPCEWTQAHNASKCFSEASGTTGQMMLESSGDANGVSRVLHWQRDDGSTWAHAQVRVKDQFHNSMILLWPPDLPLVIHAAGTTTLELQKWIQKNHAPMSRIECASGMDNRDFNSLINALRKCGGYATVWWEAGGSYQARLLLAPLATTLLCASFPVKGIPDLPISRSPVPDYIERSVATSSGSRSRPVPLLDPVTMRPFPEHLYDEAAHGVLYPQGAQPQLWVQPQADYPSLNIIEPPQVDHNLSVPWNQTTFLPAHATMLPHVQLEQQQAFPHVPLQHRNVQQNQHVTTLNMLSGSSQLDDSQTVAGATSWEVVYPSDGFGFTSPLKENSGSYLDIGATGSTAADTMDDIFGDTDDFQSRAGSGLDVGDGLSHGWF